MGMHPSSQRIEDSQGAPMPRLGRSGLGPLGPRSATPITPFRVRSNR